MSHIDEMDNRARADHKCPYCEADKGSPCISTRTGNQVSIHSARHAKVVIAD